MAVVCFIFFAGFWGVGMGDSPEMGTFRACSRRLPADPLDNDRPPHARVMHDHRHCQIHCPQRRS